MNNNDNNNNNDNKRNSNILHLYQTNVNKGGIKKN